MTSRAALMTDTQSCYCCHHLQQRSSLGYCVLHIKHSLRIHHNQKQTVIYLAIFDPFHPQISSSPFSICIGFYCAVHWRACFCIL